MGLRKANLNARDDNSAAPIHYAVGRRQTDAVRELGGMGADVNAKDNDGCKPQGVVQIRNKGLFETKDPVAKCRSTFRGTPKFCWSLSSLLTVSSGSILRAKTERKCKCCMSPVVVLAQTRRHCVHDRGEQHVHVFRTTIGRAGSTFWVQQNRCMSHARFTFSPVRHGQGTRSR